MNTLLSLNSLNGGNDIQDENTKNDDIASDLLEDINNADEFLMNQKALALEINSAHSSKRKNSSELKDLVEQQEGTSTIIPSLKRVKITDERDTLPIVQERENQGTSEKVIKNDSLSFTSNTEDEMIKKDKFDEMEIESAFHCSKHLFHPIKYFCIHESVFLCNACKLDHLDHKEFIRDYSEKNLLTEMEKLNDKLVNVKHILGDFQIKVKSFLEDKIEFITSSQINSLFRSAYSFLTTPSLTQIPQTNKKQIKSREFFMESNLIKSYQEEAFILGLFREKLLKNQINFLYRASKDGFNSKDFHRFCDRKGPTLVLIKSTKDLIFGGYTSKSWKSKEKGEFQKDEKSFLFSLSQKTKHEIDESKLEKAIYCMNNRGPVFGAGFDLSISEQCDQDEESFSNLGISYECDEEMTPQEKRKYLAGEVFFKVKEMEVFGLAR